jgi:histone acetyltransferase
MPTDRYQGYIKDYDGGSLMECYIHPSINFTHMQHILNHQRDFVLEK